MEAKDTEGRMVEESYGACIKCGKKAILGDGLCVSCWDKASDQLYRKDISIPVIEKLHRGGVGEAWVDKSIPMPEGFVMVDSRGVKYRVRSGRKQIGEWRNCIDCGKLIYVRTHRQKNPNFGKRCTSCNRKVYLPPKKRKSQLSDKS